MLPRLPAVPRLSRQTARQAAHRRGFAGSPPRRQPVAPALRHWLAAPGSLTARLRLLGEVTVEVLSQGRQTLWPQERAALGCRQGHVREVVLRINGRPAVWARSSTPLTAVKGPWRAIKGLGTRPLAELLFEHGQVRREPLIAQRLAQQGPQRRHLARQWACIAWDGEWLADKAAEDDAPGWSRRSVFRYRGHPLQVLECFAPWVTPLPAGSRR